MGAERHGSAPPSKILSQNFPCCTNCRKAVNSRNFGCEVLKAMKIRSAGLIRAITSPSITLSAGRSLSASVICGNRLLKFLAISRIQNRFAARFDADGAIAVEFNFVGPIRTFGELGHESAFHRLDELGSSL
jgi:hypothetical protein